jgi:transposase-like protein
MMSPSEQEHLMSRRPHRNHTTAFKAKVAVVLAAIHGDKPLAELAQQFDVHPNQITQRKTQLVEGAMSIFDGKRPGGGSPVDLQPMHVKIGELTLENDFLEHALIKAGMLSVKR